MKYSLKNLKGTLSLLLVGACVAPVPSEIMADLKQACLNAERSQLASSMIVAPGFLLEYLQSGRPGGTGHGEYTRALVSGFEYVDYFVVDLIDPSDSHNPTAHFKRPQMLRFRIVAAGLPGCFVPRGPNAYHDKLKSEGKCLSVEAIPSSDAPYKLSFESSSPRRYGDGLAGGGVGENLTRITDRATGETIFLDVRPSARFSAATFPTLVPGYGGADCMSYPEIKLRQLRWDDWLLPPTNKRAN